MRVLGCCENYDTKCIQLDCYHTVQKIPFIYWFIQHIMCINEYTYLYVYMHLYIHRTTPYFSWQIKAYLWLKEMHGPRHSNTRSYRKSWMKKEKQHAQCSNQLPLQGTCPAQVFNEYIRNLMCTFILEIVASLVTSMFSFLLCLCKWDDRDFTSCAV